MKRASFGLSDLGNKRRNNEDRFLRDDRRGIYIVCDGMGGAAAGEVASGNSAAQVYSDLMAQPELLSAFAAGSLTSVRDMTNAVERAIQKANAHVFAQSQANPDRKGMGTTLSALVLGGGSAVVGHVGDSRVYQLHGQEALPLTQDHTWVAEQVRLGLMTEDEAKTSNRQNLIMRALGIRPEVQVDCAAVPVSTGDRFLLCSDGLHGYLRDAGEVTQLMRTEGSLQRLALTCIAVARQRGGKDNITALVVDVEPG